MAGIKAFDPYGQVTVDLHKIRNTNVFLATPCYGGLVTEPFHRSMLNFTNVLQSNTIPFTSMTLANESLVTRARNTLVAAFLERQQCTHLMFVDADIEFGWDSILKLLDYDKDVVVGAYPKKGIEWQDLHTDITAGIVPIQDTELHSISYALNFETTDDGKLISENGLFKLKDAGTGFMLIKRDVFNQLINKFPEIKYTNDINIHLSISNYFYAFFDTSIDKDSNRYLSEDYTFCRRWQSIGGVIWLDPNIQLNHVGHHVYAGHIQKIFRTT
jgi:hypothetical protein